MWKIIGVFILLVTVAAGSFVTGARVHHDRWQKDDSMAEFERGATNMRDFLRQFPGCRPHLPDIKTFDLDKGENIKAVPSTEDGDPLGTKPWRCQWQNQDAGILSCDDDEGETCLVEQMDGGMVRTLACKKKGK
jgi:hypothetical protein